MKDGIQSTEFWLTLVAVIGSILVATGVLAETEATYLHELVKQIVSGLVALVTLVTYILSRTGLKKEQIRMEMLKEVDADKLESLKETVVSVG